MSCISRLSRTGKNATPRNACLFLIAAILYVFLTSSFALAQAPAPDDFGPPPEGDPSAHTGPLIGDEFAIDLLGTLPHANHGAYEGGPTGTAADAGINNAVPEGQQTSGGSFEIPTSSRPSPLFGALPFEQQMLRFEEYGTDRLVSNSNASKSFPLPSTGPGPEQDPTSVAASQPAGSELDAFLADPGLSPAPARMANTQDENPWKQVIENFIGRPLETPPAEGRPPGEGWAHQRWNEMPPQVYFKTVMAGARVNGGVRDNKQRHEYKVGEFAPGGLYHKIYESSVPGSPVLEGTTKGLGIRLHPRMPVQDHKSIWTFDGTLPPKLLTARVGETILMRHYNALPVDPAANRGFGLHTISTHEHNGHNPAESDGFTNAFFFPGQYYDYRWPMQLAGYDTINTDAKDPRAAFPCTGGETIFVNDAEPGVKSCDGISKSVRVRGDWRETMSTKWFHDHMLDFTAQNVYKGNAAVMNIYSVLDRGKEDLDDGMNLRFPSGTALEWGNRDYDVNLLVADKAWDQEGQLWFNIFNMDGFVGDQITVNWLYKPYFDVRARRYRFRILNGSVARYFKMALVKEVQGNGGEMPGPSNSGVSYTLVPFHMIANDGNILEHSIPFDGSMDLDSDGNSNEHRGMLPTHAIAERYDIIVDFSKHGIQPGDKLYFVNVMEHKNGRRPSFTVPLNAVLSGQYSAELNMVGGIPERWINGDPGVGKILEFRVHSYAGEDRSMDPNEYIPGGKKMIPLALNRDDPVIQAQLANARHRTFEFGRSSGTDEAPWTVKTDGGSGLVADPRRISAAPQLAQGPTEAGFSGDGTLEIWSLVGNGGWSHPVHVHFEEGIILSRDGAKPPEWERWARKDIYRIGPEEDTSSQVELAIRFRDFAGTYVEHCHNTQHEDHAMLLRWDLEHPGQVQLMPTPLPTWDGVEYVDSAALPTFRTGDGTGPQSINLPDPNPNPNPAPTSLENQLRTTVQNLRTRLDRELAKPVPNQQRIHNLRGQLADNRRRLDIVSRVSGGIEQQELAMRLIVRLENLQKRQANASVPRPGLNKTIARVQARLDALTAGQ